MAVGFFLPSARLMTGDGWSNHPSSVPAFAGPYLLGAIAVLAVLAIFAADKRARAVALWVAIALSVIAALSAAVFESLLFLDCLENQGRSPDLVRATTGRVAAALAVAWPAFFVMLAVLLRGGPAQALYARVLTLSGLVLVTWFACLHMAAEAGYGVWTSLAASLALTGFGALAWKRHPARSA